jgi:hypothetical protein
VAVLPRPKYSVIHEIAEFTSSYKYLVYISYISAKNLYSGCSSWS